VLGCNSWQRTDQLGGVTSSVVDYIKRRKVSWQRQQIKTLLYYINL